MFDYHRFNSDFLICQETHSTSEIETIWANEWGGGAIYSHGTSTARGIAVFYLKKFHANISNIIKDVEGRYIIFDLENDGHFVTIVALYAPNNDSPEFFSKIRELIKTRYDYKILVGDYNLTLDVELDRLNTYSNNTKARDTVLDMMEQYKLTDTWRVQNEQVREYSWIKSGRDQKASRIDFALISAGLDQFVEVIQYLSSVMTDHRALYICIDLKSFERGKGFWKLNTALLQNQSYIECMNTILQKEVAQSSSELTAQQKWEKIKTKVKQETIEFSRKNVSEQKLILAQLSERVNYYEANLPLPEEETNIWLQSKKDLEDVLMESVRGIMFRSKAKWYEEGERSTKYFFSLEKARYNSKTCFKIFNAVGEEIVVPEQILEVQKEFYQELYSEDQQVTFTLQNEYGVMVPRELKESQDIQITKQELEVAIKSMNNNKTPGQDGIPVDFYKVFWKYLKEPFFEMMLESYEQQQLHETASKGILNLIPKANKDPRSIKNLRPITLLNTDYKIIEKAIALKILPSLDHIISKDQRGFMKNRRISVNIRKMLDLMYYTKKEDLEAVVLSLDFVKCFDKCSFSILHGSLEFFGFGKVVKQWTEILYRNFTVKIQNNGYFSSPISIRKGVH